MFGVEVMQEAVKSSQQVIKEANMKMVFGLIHKEGPISRADIKKITGLSATTVSSLVEELMESGFVSEGGVKDTHTSGRKAVLLHVRADGGCFVGLDIQKDLIVADTYGLDFTPVFHTAVPVLSGEKLTLGILRAIGAASHGRHVLGVTIGLPGVIDASTNTVLSSTVLDTEIAADVYQTVCEALPEAKISLRNNSGLVAYAEKEFGMHGEIRNLVSIDIESGVGAGIILDGAIYDGAGGMAGEFGHMSIDYRGKRCKCGNYGCLELTASVPAILERTKCDSLKHLRKKLDSGDVASLEALEEIARALAFGINNIINIIDPELIVIGGSVRELGAHFIEPMKQYIKHISLTKDKELVYSALETNPVTLGGARYSFDEMFGV